MVRIRRFDPAGGRFDHLAKTRILNLGFDLLELHDVLDAAVQKIPGDLVVGAIIANPIKNGCGIHSAKGGALRVPVYVD